MTIIKEPLLYFLLLGAAIYYVLATGTQPQDNSTGRHIVVDEKSILTYIQYRRRQFDPVEARQYLQDLSAAARQELINDFVREEVLYREALSLGLDQNDYLIKLRLVQKMEFLTDAIDSSANFDETALEAFYKLRQSDYQRVTNFSFSHFYFTGEDALKDAESALASLVAGHPVPAGLEKRFPFGGDLSNQTDAEIINKFGTGFAREIMTADENTQAWLGPVMSNHGWHLVKIVNRQDAYIPSLQAIYQQVSRDFTTSRTSLSREQNIDQLISTYTLEYLPLPIQPAD